MRSIVGKVLRTVLVVGAFGLGSVMVGSGCSSSSKSPADSGIDSHGAGGTTGTGGATGSGGTTGSGGATATDAGRDGTADVARDSSPDLPQDSSSDLPQDVAVDGTTGG